MCVLYYFDMEKQRYYFESSSEAEMLRFVAYKRYDKERLTKSGFVVPVSRVGKMLVPESELHKYPLSSVRNNREEQGKSL
ncbi:MAG: hypothetical protein E7378_03600 [Clostridiales bacterium]|nr:hypothetical protein [Clostridiales bacterium]